MVYIYIFSFIYLYLIENVLDSLIQDIGKNMIHCNQPFELYINKSVFLLYICILQTFTIIYTIFFFALFSTIIEKCVHYIKYYRNVYFILDIF
jgi:hypothetical protein